MEVVVRVPPASGNFGGSPYSSSHYYLSSPLISSLSAPASPSHAFNFFRFDDDVPIGSPSAVPFRWEDKPGTPKFPAAAAGDHDHHHDQDFEFDFTSNAHSFSIPSLPADELFHGGKIKPLKPPPGFQSNISSPRSPHNSKLSPRKSKSSIDMNIADDPFEAALIKETLSHGSNAHDSNYNNKNRATKTDKISYISSNFPPKHTRSLDRDDDNSFSGAGAGISKPSSFLSAISFSKPGRSRWRLRDLLFRSATEKSHQLRSTYVSMSSFRSADGADSRFHFPAADRSVSQELLKKKSFLFNKSGFLSRCLRFNRSGIPKVNSSDVGSLTRG